MFDSVAVAGTFDHLHLGHQKLLTAALAAGRSVSVGLTTKKFVQQKPFSGLIESYRTRLNSVKKLAVRFGKTPHVLALNDPFGQAPHAADLDAVVCTPDTKANVNRINQLRQLNRVRPVTPIIVDLVPSSDRKILSSTRIRQGLVNRQGFAFQQIFNRRVLTLPPASRKYFQKPFSRLVKTIKQPRFLTISVGDIATMALLQQNIRPDLAIVDLKTKRQTVFDSLQDLGLKPGLTAVNPASTITADLVKKLLACFEAGKQTLLIKGEEDLAVLPSILLSPLKTTIFYGQPDQGLVQIRVSESAKAKALQLLQKFI